MRLNINLATKPYQDVRRLLLQWGGVILVLACCTVALVYTSVRSWQESREVNARIAAVQAEIAALERQHTQAVATLRQPQNSDVVETSHFLNGLIARKSFSWTRVFMQLEEMMPPGLHVLSISPVLEPRSNTVEMRLTVAGTSREAAVELVKRLERSSSFTNARIAEESEIEEKNSTDTVRFQLNATYVPRDAATTPAAPLTASAQESVR